MRRRSSGNFWWVFLFFIFFANSDAFATLFLLAIAAVVGYLLYRSVKSSETNTHTNPRASGRRSTVRRYGMSDSSHSSDQKAWVNSWLLKQYRNGINPVRVSTSGGHTITLTMKSERFTNLDALETDCDGHYFRSVTSFRQKYPALYNEMFDCLLAAAKEDGKVRNPDVVDAEYTERTETMKEEPKPQQNAKKAGSAALSDAESFRETINDLNDAIPDEEISNSLYETTSLLKQLSDLEKRFPDQKPRLNKLYKTYLPYLVEILNQYKTLQHVETDANYKENEENLKKTIGHINAAMRDHLIPSMSESDSINLSADMSTLEAMLRKDGMTADDDIQQAMRKERTGS